MRISDWSSDVCSSDLVILIDCQPSLGLLTVNALTAAHGVLIPLECEFFALRGVALLVETIEKVRDRLNPAIGRASCRERVCPYGLIPGVAVSLKKTSKSTTGTRGSNTHH